MARKKKALPFVVQPRYEPIVEKIGTEESGIIEIQRRGYLTVAEKAMVQGGVGDDEVMRNLVGLAAKIQRKVGKSQQEVIGDLTKEPRPDYLQPWEEEIAAILVQMLAFQERTAIVQATAMCVSRIDAEWTVEETMELHPEILNGLVSLYAEEERRSVAALEDAATVSQEEIEGKS